MTTSGPSRPYSGVDNIADGRAFRNNVRSSSLKKVVLVNVGRIGEFGDRGDHDSHSRMLSRTQNDQEVAFRIENLRELKFALMKEWHNIPKTECDGLSAQCTLVVSAY